MLVEGAQCLGSRLLTPMSRVRTINDEIALTLSLGMNTCLGSSAHMSVGVLFSSFIFHLCLASVALDRNNNKTTEWSMVITTVRTSLHQYEEDTCAHVLMRSRTDCHPQQCRPLPSLRAVLRLQLLSATLSRRRTV